MRWGEADWGELIWGLQPEAIPALGDSGVAIAAFLLIAAGVLRTAVRRSRRMEKWK